MLHIGVVIVRVRLAGLARGRADLAGLALGHPEGRSRRPVARAEGAVERRVRLDVVELGHLEDRPRRAGAGGGLGLCMEIDDVISKAREFHSA